MEYFEGLKNLTFSEDQEIYVVSNDENSKLNVLVEGDFKGRHFAIVRHRGGFPDAYLEIMDDDYIAKTDCNDNEPRYEIYQGCVHGGATYYGKAYWNDDDKRTYIGWDYAHSGDFISGAPYPTDKKWTTLEIMMDIATAEADITWQNDDHWEELHPLKE